MDMRTVCAVFGTACISLSSFELIVHTLIASFGGGREYSMQIGLLRIIATGVVGIGFLLLSKNK